MEESTIEEWTLTEKESIAKETNGEKSSFSFYVHMNTDLSATVATQKS